MAVLLLFSAILMEFAARLSEGINQDMPHPGEELSLIRLPFTKIFVYDSLIDVFLLADHMG